MIDRILAVPRPYKKATEIGLDVITISLSLWAAFALRYSQWWPADVSEHLWLFIAAPLIAFPIFVTLGLYRAVLRFISTKAFNAIAVAVTLHVVALVLFAHLVGLKQVPITLFVIYWLMVMVLVGGSRFTIRGLLQWHMGSKRSPVRIIIYGTGPAAVELAKSTLGWSHYLPMAFIDDKRNFRGGEIQGLTVYPSQSLGKLIGRYGIQEILLAIPTASRERRREVLAFLEKFPVHVKTVPSLRDLLSGKSRLEDIREIEIEDLLGREPIPPNNKLLAKCITGKSVLITGAGGSIGSELCRQILQLRPKRLVLFEASEHALYQINKELCRYKNAKKETVEHVGIIPVLGTVTDPQRIKSVIGAFAVDTLFHASAYKHVPLVEFNPTAGVVNNVFGTLNTATAAVESGITTFILVSTDKAVRPTNIMGTTKRISELIVQSIAQNSASTCFGIVRFGNVLGSSGSVVPLFREQIKAGRAVTVTHPKVIRYFMTIPEAAQLVIQAASLVKNAEVFVLDMGDPVKILDLAHRMIHLSGLKVKNAESDDGDIAVEFTGLRPGEKLYEELLLGDNVTSTEHPRILRAQEKGIQWSELLKILDDLKRDCDLGDNYALRQHLMQAVSEYKPQCGIEDPVWLATNQHSKLAAG